MNSIRFVMQAIESEAKRQIEIYEDGGEIPQSTLRFDKNTGKTSFMRSKEDAHDYRYFPDPDLLPLEINEEFIEDVRQTLPELPDAKKKRFMEEYGLPEFDATQLVSEKEIANYFECAVNGNKEKAKLIANWMIVELFAYLNRESLSFEQNPIKCENLSGLVGRILDNTISGKIAKEIFEIMTQNPNKTPDEIIEEKGLKQITDTGAIEAVIDEIISKNPEKVAEIKSGKDKLIGWFVGQTMAQTGGKANPGIVQDLLKKKLQD
jgi:aspartyl-tRNA(Asn)/glutamyl-tRNA(Gln) amidotransferase subunit B